MTNPREVPREGANSLVLHLERRIHTQLLDDARDHSTAAFDIVTFQAEPLGMAKWLELRQASLPALSPRPWTESDFRREFLDQPWWHPARMWFAQVVEGENCGRTVGTVALALRSADRFRGAHLHWLLVEPSWRRAGIARQLLRVAENQARQCDYHLLQVETLSTWKEAVCFYQQAGFIPRAPRV